jgi:hypothetical protein
MEGLFQNAGNCVRSPQLNKIHHPTQGQMPQNVQIVFPNSHGTKDRKPNTTR